MAADMLARVLLLLSSDLQGYLGNSCFENLYYATKEILTYDESDSLLELLIE